MSAPRLLLIAITGLLMFLCTIRGSIQLHRTGRRTPLLFVSAATLCITAMLVYQARHTFGQTLLWTSALAFTDLIARWLVFIRLNRKQMTTHIATVRLIYGLLEMIVLSCACTYIGYLLGGGDTSVWILIAVLLGTFSLLAFIGWLQYGRSDQKTGTQISG